LTACCSIQERLALQSSVEPQAIELSHGMSNFEMSLVSSPSSISECNIQCHPKLLRPFHQTQILHLLCQHFWFRNNRIFDFKSAEKLVCLCTIFIAVLSKSCFPSECFVSLAAFSRKWYRLCIRFRNLNMPIIFQLRVM
jgi:hypothetical protein